MYSMAIFKFFIWYNFIINIQIQPIFSNTVHFVQLRNRLNGQYGEMLKAQQRALLVRHQHKDVIIQNIDDLQQSNTSPVFTCERPLAANVQNSVPEARVADATDNQSSTSPGDASSSQAPNVNESLVLKPNVYVRRSFRSSDYSSESFGQKITSDVPSYSDSFGGACSANSMEQQSSILPLIPGLVKNSVQANANSDSSSPASSCFSSPLTVNDFRENEPVKSLGIEPALPLAYMPPLTVSVTNTQFPVLNCQPGSTRYFGGKFDVMSSAESTPGMVGSSEETSRSNSLLLKKPNCVFASKRVIANTYLSRRPPVFSPVFAETRSDSVNSQLTASSQIDNSSVLLSHPTTSHSTNTLTVSADSTRPSIAELSVAPVSSPAVPPRLANNEAGQILCHPSLHELHEASSSSVKPPVSVTAVSAGGLSSASSNESLYSNSLLTDVVASSNISPALVTRGSAFMPFQALSPTVVSSVSPLPATYAHDVLFKGTYSPALPTSDLSVKRPLSEITYSNSVTAHVIPQALDSLPQVTASFSNRLSSSEAAVGSPSDTAALLPVDLVNVSSSSEVSSVTQLDGPGIPCSDKSLENQPPSTLPTICCSTPCMLTISTHIPVSSPAIDTAASSSHAILLDTVNNAAIGAVSFSSNLIQSNSPTTAADVPHSQSLK